MKTVSVDAGALKEVLEAFMTGQTHRVLELQAIQSLPGSTIGILLGNYNDAVDQHNILQNGVPVVGEPPRQEPYVGD